MAKVTKSSIPELKIKRLHKHKCTSRAGGMWMLITIAKSIQKNDIPCMILFNLRHSNNRNMSKPSGKLATDFKVLYIVCDK